MKNSSDYYDPREPLTERKLLQIWLDCAEPREKRIAELEERIHILEVYLEGAVNYLILAGDTDNRIISNVETILHMTFNRSPNVPNVFQKFTKAKELIKKFLIAKSIEDTCVAESEAEQFLKEIKSD